MTSNQYYYVPKTTGLDNLTLGNGTIPKPGRAQVLVKVHASSLNYRDLASIIGKYPSTCIPNFIPNSDGAAEVVEVGDDVLDLKKGDRVYPIFAQSWQGGNSTQEHMKSALGCSSHGMLTQYRVLNETGLKKIPSYLSYEEASTLTCAAVTAWNCLFEGPNILKSGEVVLIIGTGGVGIWALQFAKAAGARVIILSSSNEKIKKAKSLGADEGVNYKENPDWDKNVLELTNGEGVDHVVENGGSGTLEKSAKSTRFAGHIGVIGFLDSAAEKGIGGIILGRGLIIRGIHTGSAVMYDRMNRALEFHKIKPVIDKEFPFAEALEAFKYLEKQEFIGKVVINKF